MRIKCCSANQPTSIHLFIVGFRAEHPENGLVGPERLTCGPNATTTATRKKGAVDCTFPFLWLFIYFKYIFVYAYCAFIWTHTHHQTESSYFLEFRFLFQYGHCGCGIGGWWWWCSLGLSLNKTIIYAFTCKFMRHSQSCISSLSVSLIRMRVSCVWPLWLAMHSNIEQHNVHVMELNWNEIHEGEQPTKKTDVRTRQRYFRLQWFSFSALFFSHFVPPSKRASTQK